jgi:hypothetical protein
VIGAWRWEWNDPDAVRTYHYTLPPDPRPTTFRIPWVDTCNDAYPGAASLYCTRLPDHGGRHHHGDGSRVVAVWHSRTPSK